MAKVPVHDALYMHVPDMRQVLSAQLSSSSSPFSSFSSSSTSPRTPVSGTQYTTLSAWSSFDAEVEDFVKDLTSKFPGAMCNDMRELRPDMWGETYRVNTEHCVQDLFRSRILLVVSAVLKAVACPGLPLGSTATSVFGIPDLIWVLEESDSAVLCMEVKSPWYLKNVTNIIEQSSSADCDQKLRASIEQIYGYMALNNHKYGVLTTYESTWIFRRGRENKDVPSHQMLEVAGPFRTTPLSEILEGQGGGGERKISVIGALTFLLHQVKEDWMHSSLQDTAGMAAALANEPPLVCSYNLVRTAVEDQRIMLQDRLRVRGNSRIIKGKLHGISEDVIFKAVDCYNGTQSHHELEKEVENYRLLEKLQGNVIPKFLGYFNKGGLLHLMALENSGVDVTSVTKEDKEIMKDLLCKLHAEGFVHGDVALRNFVKDSSGKWRLIDLGSAELTSDEEARRKDFEDFEDFSETLQSKV